MKPHQSHIEACAAYAGGVTLLEACNPQFEPILIGGENETRVAKTLGKAAAFQGFL